MTVAAPAAQYTNSLAPGNATAQAVRVPFTKFTLTAGASDATVNGVTVERVGYGSDSNFSGVVLLDENGVQMDIEKTLGSDHRATIGGTFKVPAGTTKTYTVAGNMANNAARAGQVVAFSVVLINTTETGKIRYECFPFAIITVFSDKYTFEYFSLTSFRRLRYPFFNKLYNFPIISSFRI